MQRPIATTAVLSSFLLAGMAIAIDLEAVTGFWTNVVGGGATVNFQTVGNEVQVRWGRSAGFGQSGLGFTPNAALPLLDLAVDEEFEIGTLRHFNQPTFAPSASGVDLALDLDFGNPDVVTMSTFTLAIANTPNAGPCPVGVPPCPDIITFPSSFPSEIFFVDGVTFALQFVGFRTDPNGPLVDEFVSDEGGIQTAQLFGRLTIVCVRTQGFWKNHPDEWLTESLDLGDFEYSQDELLQVLAQPTRRNGLVALAHQLIAAKLNQLAAPVGPPSVEAAIDMADALINGQVVPPIGGGYLHPQVTSLLVEILDEYNMGLAQDGPISCDIVEEEEDDD